MATKGEPLHGLRDLAGRLLHRANAAGTVSGVVTWEDLRTLMCGIAYAAQVHSDDLETRLDSGRRCLRDAAGDPRLNQGGGRDASRLSSQ